jgi:hypothetical protein
VDWIVERVAKKACPWNVDEPHETHVVQIQDGTEARRQFLEMISSPDLSLIEQQQIRQRFFEYCATDTAGMVAIVRRLRELDSW